MDKILTEAFDKLKAIEESEDPFCIGAKDEPIEEANDPFCIGELSENEEDIAEDEEVIEEAEEQFDEEGDYEDVKLHDAAIDLLDDMLFALDKNDQYGEKGNILRYAIGRLQQVGLGR